MGAKTLIRYSSMVKLKWMSGTRPETLTHLIGREKRQMIASPSLLPRSNANMQLITGINRKTFGFILVP